MKMRSTQQMKNSTKVLQATTGLMEKMVGKWLLQRRLQCLSGLGFSSVSSVSFWHLRLRTFYFSQSQCKLYKIQVQYSNCCIKLCSDCLPFSGKGGEKTTLFFKHSGIEDRRDVPLMCVAPYGENVVSLLRYTDAVEKSVKQVVGVCWPRGECTMHR